jgi:hypothetical protein
MTQIRRTLCYENSKAQKKEERILTTYDRHYLSSSHSTNANVTKENHLLVGHQTEVLLGATLLHHNSTDDNHVGILSSVFMG